MAGVALTLFRLIMLLGVVLVTPLYLGLFALVLTVSLIELSKAAACKAHNKKQTPHAVTAQVMVHLFKVH